jgi:hypothetical protein
MMHVTRNVHLTIDQLSTVDNISRIRELAIPECSRAPDWPRIVPGKTRTKALMCPRQLLLVPTQLIQLHISIEPRLRLEVPIALYFPDGGNQHRVAYPNENGSQFYPSNSYHCKICSLPSVIPTQKTCRRLQGKRGPTAITRQVGLHLLGAMKTV